MDSTADELTSQLMNKTIKSLHKKSSGAKFPIIADLNFQRDMLEAHNKIRTRYGCVSLTWSQHLGDQAQEWATNLSHKGIKLYRELPNVGETICFYPVSQSCSGHEVTDLWEKRKQNYNYAHPGWSGGSQEFSQVVWRASREFGCARAVHEGQSVVVAFYKPGGNTNYPGDFQRNVPKPMDS